MANTPVEHLVLCDCNGYPHTESCALTLKRREMGFKPAPVQARAAAPSVDEETPLVTSNPFEQQVERALRAAGEPYTTDHGGTNESHLDFCLTNKDIHIEVKTMHSDRVAEQMSRVSNVIVAQGASAIQYLAEIITRAATLRPVGDDASAALEELRQLFPYESEIVFHTNGEVVIYIATDESTHVEKGATISEAMTKAREFTQKEKDNG